MSSGAACDHSLSESLPRASRRDWGWAGSRGQGRVSLVLPPQTKAIPHAPGVSPLPFPLQPIVSLRTSVPGPQRAWQAVRGLHPPECLTPAPRRELTWPGPQRPLARPALALQNPHSECRHASCGLCLGLGVC